MFAATLAVLFMLVGSHVWNAVRVLQRRRKTAEAA